MKINHYISALLAAICLMMAGMTSCSDHIDGPGLGGNDGDDATMQISINVVLPTMNDTRAVYERGDEYENTVNLAGGDYRLLLFRRDTRTLVCSIDPAKVQYELLNTPEYSICQITADVDKDIRSYSGLSVVVLANWGDYPDLTVGMTTIDDLAGYDASTGAVSTDPATTFDGSARLIANDRNYIPLFGIKECTGINWLSESPISLGDLWLLRAVAKIEVKSADNLPPIEWVELTRYNTLGTCAPRGVYSEKAYVAGVDQYKPVNYVTLPGNKNDSDEKKYVLRKTDPTATDEESLFVVYVPEYRILSDYSKPQHPGDDRPVLRVKFKGVDQIYDLEFKYYSDTVAAEDGARKDDYFDICRNFIYRYNVRLTGSGLAWDVDVLPYTSVELKPNFGLLLANLTLNKYVSKLYTDQAGETPSRDVLIAYDENNKQISAQRVNWRLSESITKHVCTVTKNDDGTCTVKPVAKATGRDIVEAVIIDKNGVEVVTECIIEVTERHLGLEKTFLGLIPEDILPAYSTGSFRVNIVAERDDSSTLSWKLVDANDQPLSDELQDLVTVTAEGDGGSLSSGDYVSEKNITIQVHANNQGKLGDVHLMLTYTGPDPADSSRRREYSTYCNISVSNVSLTVYPTVLNLTVGQQSSVTARTAPVFSDYIPSLAFESEDTDIVTVDDNGLVTAVGHGSTRIKVTSPDDLLNWIVPEYVDVNVVPDDLILLRSDGLPADYVELLSGEQLTLCAFSHGVDVSKTAVWDVVDDSFLTIEDGVITAGSKAGTSTVRATYTVNSVSYSETCIVAVATERKLVIADCPKGISEYGSVPMKAYVFPDSTPYDQRNYTVTWTSSDKSVIAFDDPTDKSIAVAKKPGTATLTASTTYNGQALAASVIIDVLGHDQDVEPEGPEFLLYIYDESGKKVTEINSEDKYYPGFETGQGGWNDETVDVGGEGLFDRITIPTGETWTAVVEFRDGTKIPDITCYWKMSKRYSGYDYRITIAPENNSKSCKINALTNVNTAATRYNEVDIRFEYKGMTYTRRFCVYTKF